VSQLVLSTDSNVGAHTSTPPPTQQQQNPAATPVPLRRQGINLYSAVYCTRHSVQSGQAFYRRGGFRLKWVALPAPRITWEETGWFNGSPTRTVFKPQRGGRIQTPPPRGRISTRNNLITIWAHTIVLLLPSPRPLPRSQHRGARQSEAVIAPAAVGVPQAVMGASGGASGGGSAPHAVSTHLRCPPHPSSMKWKRRLGHWKRW
jgi:hypothetical protein